MKKFKAIEISPCNAVAMLLVLSSLSGARTASSAPLAVFVRGCLDDGGDQAEVPGRSAGSLPHPRDADRLYSELRDRLSAMAANLAARCDTVRLEQDVDPEVVDRVRELLDLDHSLATFLALAEDDGGGRDDLPGILDRLAASRFMSEDQRSDASDVRSYLLPAHRVDGEMMRILADSRHSLDTTVATSPSQYVQRARKTYEALVTRHLHTLMYYGAWFHKPRSASPFDKLIAFLRFVVSPGMSPLTSEYKGAILILLPYFNRASFERAHKGVGHIAA